MKSALFIVTGCVLTAQTYWMLAWAIWGAPTNVWEYMAFFGSLLLIATGITCIWKKTFALYMALASLALIWSFYLPTIIVTTKRLMLGRAAAGAFDFLRIAIVYGLLIASTMLAVRSTARQRRRIV